MRVLILANDSGGLYNFRKELIAELLKKVLVKKTGPGPIYRTECTV